MEGNSSQTLQKQRLPEMDVMKGILSIMVILGHIVFIEQRSGGVNMISHAAYAQNILVAVWTAPCNMAAFFFVTGFCSSFAQDLPHQILSDAKRLLLPSVTIVSIMSATVALLGKDFAWSYNAPWFLWALFWAKLIFKLLCQHVKFEAVVWFLLVLMSVIGAAMMYYTPEANRLGWQQALVFPLFLAIGAFVRKVSLKPWMCYLAGGVYAVFAILTFHYLDWGPLSISAITSVAPEKWPAYFLLATSGTLFVFQVSKLSSRSRFLQFVGKNSLIVYLMHAAFLVIAASYLKSQIVQYYDNSTFQWCFFVLMGLGALLWSCLWALVFNLPFVRWLQGKW